MKKLGRDFSSKLKKLKESMKIFVISLVALTSAACVNIIRYDMPDSGTKRLETKLKRIILHEDYIMAENDALGMKIFFFNELADRLSKLKQKKVLVIKSGASLPKLVDNKGLIWIVGDIWSQSSKQSGNNVELKTLSSSSLNSSSSRDVLEHLYWEQESVMSYTNLYFFELTEKPKLLRSSITASNFTSAKVKGDKGTLRRNFLPHFEFRNLDEEAKSLFGGSNAVKRLAPGYHVVSIHINQHNQQSALKQLAEASVNKHFARQQ